MNWKLIKVKHTDWIQDNSRYYTLINWINNNNVRLDVMTTNDVPVVSFQGVASDVRKRIMQDLDRWNPLNLSYEHAAYIGAELARCELLKTDYVQD